MVTRRLIFVVLIFGGHSDLENFSICHLITVAGQRRTHTELSPLPPIAAPYENRIYQSLILSQFF